MFDFNSYIRRASKSLVNFITELHSFAKLSSCDQMYRENRHSVISDTKTSKEVAVYETIYLCKYYENCFCKGNC